LEVCVDGDGTSDSLGGSDYARFETDANFDARGFPFLNGSSQLFRNQQKARTSDGINTPFKQTYEWTLKLCIAFYAGRAFSIFLHIQQFHNCIHETERQSSYHAISPLSRRAFIVDN
jgi:hypothetical protein